MPSLHRQPLDAERKDARRHGSDESRGTGRSPARPRWRAPVQLHLQVRAPVHLQVQRTSARRGARSGLRRASTRAFHVSATAPFSLSRAESNSLGSTVRPSDRAARPVCQCAGHGPVSRQSSSLTLSVAHSVRRQSQSTESIELTRDGAEASRLGPVYILGVRDYTCTVQRVVRRRLDVTLTGLLVRSTRDPRRGDRCTCTDTCRGRVKRTPRGPPTPHAAQIARVHSTARCEDRWGPSPCVALAIAPIPIRCFGLALPSYNSGFAISDNGSSIGSDRPSRAARAPTHPRSRPLA
jgi:hypothetical protein